MTFAFAFAGRAVHGLLVRLGSRLGRLAVVRFGVGGSHLGNEPRLIRIEAFGLGTIEPAQQLVQTLPQAVALVLRLAHHRVEDREPAPLNRSARRRARRGQATQAGCAPHPGAGLPVVQSSRGPFVIASQAFRYFVVRVPINDAHGCDLAVQREIVGVAAAGSASGATARPQSGVGIPGPHSLPLGAWYGDEGTGYTYSGIENHPLPWTPALLEVKRAVDVTAGVTFNSVLLNRYRTGKDSVAWHSDDEKEFGENPIIASVSFGSTRTFQLKHKKRKDQKASVELSHGSLLIMRGATQHNWVHQIPKTAKDVAERVNLTFRVVRAGG